LFTSIRQNCDAEIWPIIYWNRSTPVQAPDTPPSDGGLRSREKQLGRQVGSPKSEHLNLPCDSVTIMQPRLDRAPLSLMANVFDPRLRARNVLVANDNCELVLVVACSGTKLATCVDLRLHRRRLVTFPSASFTRAVFATDLFGRSARSRRLRTKRWLHARDAGQQRNEGNQRASGRENDSGCP
jgi:hypothetical protein